MSPLFNGSIDSPLKYWSIMNRMYLTPAWILGSSWWMSPTLSSLPVGGITCITPTAPTGLFTLLSSVDSWYPCAAISR